MALHIIATGGTFDKHYFETTGQLAFKESHLPEMLQRARITQEVSVDVCMLMDSLDMADSHRQQILHSCKNTAAQHIIIIHGTDTMRETAHVLGEANLNKTIVFCGAMIPYAIAQSDALFNLGFACGVAQLLPHGVFVAMNGQVFDWHNVKKNKTAGVFTTEA